MLEDLLALNIWGFLLVFVRIGAGIMFMPGLSSGYVSIQVRLGIALLISLLVMPTVAHKLPILPTTPIELGLLLAAEALVGLFYAFILAAITATLRTAGSFIALFSSLANALIQDPLTTQQSSIIAGLLSTMGLLMIFVTGTHFLMLQALVATYEVFEPGVVPPFGDFAEFMARRVADSFALGLQMSLPLALSGLTYYIGIGIIGRLMPLLPVFFFGMPAQIAMQMTVLIASMSMIMIVFMREMTTTLHKFIGS